MVFTKAVFFDGGTVFQGTISFIGVPGVLGEFGVEPAHIFIPPGLGEDAGSGDRREDRIPPDDATVRCTPVPDEAITIDQQKLWSYSKLVQGQVHSFERGLQDIDTVDLVMVYAGHGPRQGVSFNIWPEKVAVLFGDLFGVVQ